MSFLRSIYTEGIAAEHPDIKDQENFRKKADDILAARRKRRAKEDGPQLPSFIKKSKSVREEKDHEHSMARSEVHKIENSIKALKKKLKGEGNLEAWVQSKITRAADYLDSAANYVSSGEHNVEESYSTISEMEMTPTHKKKEAALKKKYDDSDMKKNMIAQYGAEKGPKVYFAKIRKMAMGEEVRDMQEMAPLVGAGLAAGAAALGAAAINKARQSANSGKNAAKSGAKVAPSGGISGAAYNLQKRNQMLNQVMNQSFDYDGDTLEERKLSRTAKRAQRAGKPGYDAEGKPKPKGKVRAWDMDETLMRNDPKKIRVHVKDKEGKRIQSLTNQEFNTHKLDKDKGHSYDFDEFRSSEKFSKAATPNKSMVKKLKKQVRRGKPVHIVTARGSFDDQPKFAKHLRKHGIEIDPGKGKGGRHVHVHRAGDMPGSDIGEKKVNIVKGLMKKHGTSGAEMYDDAAKVHRAFKKSAKENPTQPKVKTKMVQPNKKDTTQARSFKEEIDLDFIYDFILEQLVLEGYAEDQETASDLVESFDDELLEDLILESLDIIESSVEETYEIEEETSYKLNYVSPYRGIQEQRQLEKETLDENVTPYDYWKTFIGSDTEEEVVEIDESVVEDIIEQEPNLTSYEKWKLVLESNEKNSK